MPRQPEQLTFDHSGERQRRGDARHDANADEPQHFAHHHPHHLPLLRPKRHTNPYLPRSLRHGVRHHAIKSITASIVARKPNTVERLAIMRSVTSELLI